MRAGVPWLLTLLLLAPLACAGPDPVDPAAEREIPPFEVPLAREGVRYQRFLAFGDWGTGSADQRRTAAAMARFARGEGLDFLLTLGDNFYDHGVDAIDDPQWRTKFEEVYADPALAVPVFASLGNHDYQGNVQAQLDYARRNPRWRLPARYYSFTRPLDGEHQLRVVCLDTTPLGWRRSDPEQLAWLDALLAEDRARWTLVVGHHPLYSHSKRPYNLTLIRRLEPLLVKHRVDVYLAGHDHTLELLKPVRGVHHVVSGAGGGPGKAYPVRWTDASHYAATGGGFLACRVSADALLLQFVRMDGETQYAHTLYKGRQGPF